MNRLKSTNIMIATLLATLLWAMTVFVDGSAVLENFKHLETFHVDHHEGEDATRNGIYKRKQWEGCYDLTGTFDGGWWANAKHALLRLHHQRGTSTYTLSSYTQGRLNYRLLGIFTEESLESEFQRQMSLNGQSGKAEPDGIGKQKVDEKLDHTRQRHEDIMPENGKNEKDIGKLIAERQSLQTQLEQSQEKSARDIERYRAQIEQHKERKKQLSEEIGTLQSLHATLKQEKQIMEDDFRKIKEDLRDENARLLVDLDNRATDLQCEIDERQQVVIHAEHWNLRMMYIGGGVLVVIGFIILVLSRRSWNKLSDDMNCELNEQRKKIQRIPGPVPMIPRVRAGRWRANEHPAVRDVFGMKEPWDVTAGEGFQVSRITGTAQTGTDEGDEVVIEIPSDSKNVKESDIPEGVLQSRDEAEGKSQARLAELCEQFDI